MKAPVTVIAYTRDSVEAQRAEMRAWADKLNWDSVHPSDHPRSRDRRMAANGIFHVLGFHTTNVHDCPVCDFVAGERQLPPVLAPMIAGTST